MPVLVGRIKTRTMPSRSYLSVNAIVIFDPTYLAMKTMGGGFAIPSKQRVGEGVWRGYHGCRYLQRGSNSNSS